MGYVDFLHGGNIYEVRQRYGKEIIDFSANINPLGLPQSAKKAIYKNFDRILHYPDSKANNITQKIAKYWRIDKENVLPGNGSVEFIYLIMSAFKPKTTRIATPAFSEYERAARSVKSKIRFVRLKEKEGFRLNISQLGSADISFLCNPNNPTGNLILENDKLPKKLLVIDEAFMDFLPDQKNYTFIWKATKCTKIIVLRSFTKFFALPGLRIGYLVAHKEVIARLRQQQPPWSTNCLAQLAAELILNDREYIKKTHKLIENQRQFLFRELTKIKWLRLYPSVTNFLLLKIENGRITAKALQKSLLQKGILVRDCSNFRNLNDKYIRIAVRSHKENLKLIAALKKIR
ncbi:threonine-phosphate decarboxylase [Patescibacteria group bacterium]|nr:threonine-phosphate decarboxylase [Patescibacteria group bacterium]